MTMEWILSPIVLCKIYNFCHYKPLGNAYLHSDLCVITDRYHKYYTANKASTYETWNKIEIIFEYRAYLWNLFIKFIEFYESKGEFRWFLRYLKRKISKFETILKFCFLEYGDINCHNMTQLCIDHKTRHRVLPFVENDLSLVKPIRIYPLLDSYLYCLAKETCKDLFLYMGWNVCNMMMDISIVGSLLESHYRFHHHYECDHVCPPNNRSVMNIYAGETFHDQWLDCGSTISMHASYPNAYLLITNNFL